LLADDQRDRIDVVLVSPRNPLNIGAAARAMANFGFTRLSVVDPYEPHWREAKSAIGAEDLLQNARRTQTLKDAVADCTLVLGTGTLAHRKPEQPVIPLPLLAPFIREKEKSARVALVFGPEKRGLTREDLALCHLLVEIPTHPRQPSMNLGQAVAVCLYQLSTRSTSITQGLGGPGPDSGTRDRAESPDPPATSRDLDLLVQVIEKTMAAVNYSASIMRNANHHDLHLIVRRLALTHRDVPRILGLFRRILWQFEHRAGSR
jgi:TrmH family RNA methyltransferase